MPRRSRAPVLFSGPVVGRAGARGGRRACTAVSGGRPTGVLCPRPSTAVRTIAAVTGLTTSALCRQREVRPPCWGQARRKVTSRPASASVSRWPPLSRRQVLDVPVRHQDGLSAGKQLPPSARPVVGSAGWLPRVLPRSPVSSPSAWVREAKAMGSRGTGLGQVYRYRVSIMKARLGREGTAKSAASRASIGCRPSGVVAYGQGIDAGWSSSVARWAHNPEVAWFKSCPRYQQGQARYAMACRA